jgi:hypothetical protein
MEKHPHLDLKHATGCKHPRLKAENVSYVMKQRA